MSFPLHFNSHVVFLFQGQVDNLMMQVADEAGYVVVVFVVVVVVVNC